MPIISICVCANLTCVGHCSPEVMKARSQDKSRVIGETKGARAKEILRVVDQDGLPVMNARIYGSFWPGDNGKKYILVDGLTDVNGEYVAEGMSKWKLTYQVTKAGYYMSNGAIDYLAATNTPVVVNDKWQPYGSRRPVVLKKIEGPFILLMADCVSACMVSNTEHMVTVNALSQPVTFSSCCRGPKGGNRFSFSLHGKYMGYEFNRTNYFSQAGAIVVEKSNKYDVIVKRLSAKHLQFFDSVELWHLRPNHRLFQIVFKGEPSGGLSVSECNKLYRSITNELDSCFDVSISQRHSPTTANLLYDAEGSVPGFRFSVSISRTSCCMSITALKVLEPNKKASAPFFENEVNVDTNGL